MTLVNASLLVSLYWAALLIGRGAGSVALKRVPERGILVLGLGLSLLAMATLVQPQSTGVVLAAVAVAGMGFGPVFPVGVSRMLTRVIDQRHTGWVFAMCASGGAVLPWLTGLVSTRTGSLRIGFAVPVAAGVVLLMLAWGENALLRGSPGDKADLAPV
jgi:fucose permease